MTNGVTITCGHSIRLSDKDFLAGERYEVAPEEAAALVAFRCQVGSHVISPFALADAVVPDAEVAPAAAPVEAEDLAKLPFEQVIARAKKAGIATKRLSKDQLIAALTAAASPPAPVPEDTEPAAG